MQKNEASLMMKEILPYSQSDEDNERNNCKLCYLLIVYC